MRHCMAKNLFTHLAISKRVRYRVTTEKKYLLSSLNLFFNFFEYELLEWKHIGTRRFFRIWLPRWREFAVYAKIVMYLAMRRGFDLSRHLPASGIETLDR